MYSINQNVEKYAFLKAFYMLFVTCMYLVGKMLRIFIPLSCMLLLAILAHKIH